MSVQSEIDRIANNVTNSLNKVAGKGVTVPADANSDDLPGLIEAIETGGGGTPVIEPLRVTANGTYTAPAGVDGYSPVTVNVAGGGGGAIVPVSPKAVNFLDYDGTVLYAYTVEEAAALTELPPLPEQPGLICQGWNWSLGDIKSLARAVDVGANYITDDGKTRLYIRIAEEGRMAVTIHFTQTVAGGVTIDWGDGTDTQTVASTGNRTAKHAYANTGDYTITLDVANDCILGFGCTGSSYYCIMGMNLDTHRANCNMLKKVEIGDRVTSITPCSFKGCTSLATITIPAGITSVGESAFELCRSITGITIPAGIINISDYAIYHCQKLRRATIPASVTSIGASAFVSCSDLTGITIPDGVTSIGKNAFSGCNTLATITIPASVTSIGAGAFGSCFCLTGITIPDGITSIDSNMCYQDHSLTRATIPASVTSIGANAFGICHGAVVYDFTRSTAVPTLDNTNAFAYIPSGCVIKVPAALADEWKAATNWSTYASYIVGV